jgi:hypothetical protein
LSFEPVIELQAADFGKIVAVRIEKQVVEKIRRRFDCRRIARAQAPVDLQIASCGDLMRSCSSVLRR